MSFCISPLSLLPSMQDHVTEVLQFLQGEQAAAKSKKEEHHMQSSEDNEYEQMKTTKAYYKLKTRPPSQRRVRAA